MQVGVLYQCTVKPQIFMPAHNYGEIDDFSVKYKGLDQECGDAECNFYSISASLLYIVTANWIPSACLQAEKCSGSKGHTYMTLHV